MLCYYKILGVDNDADDSEIKLAYRKMALEWHPDKNPDNIDACTKQFAIIQQAYEVLSDKHERAWYDLHREQILNGGFDNENYEDSGINLFPYFTPACFSGFGNNDKSFYSVFGDVFERIAAEELAAGQTDKAPSFGCFDSDYEMVVRPFYQYWGGFVTRRSYSWLDKWDERKASNRRVLRLMQKDNRKAREIGQKERTLQVRELVAFVRKRDRRVQQQRKEELERRKLRDKEIDKHRLQQKSKIMSQISDCEIPSWHDHELHLQQLDEIEALLDDEFGDNCDKAKASVNISQLTVEDCNTNAHTDEDAVEANHDDLNDLFCVACEKCFKSYSSMQNHKQSKKHKDAVRTLKKHLMQEEIELLDLKSSSSSDNDAENDHSVDARRDRKLRKAKRKSRSKMQSSDSDPDCGNADRCDILLADDSIDECSKSKPASAQQLVERHVVDEQHACQICSETFTSRNKLFQHINQSGHAALKQADVVASGRKAKRNKNAKGAGKVG